MSNGITLENLNNCGGATTLIKLIAYLNYSSVWIDWSIWAVYENVINDTNAKESNARMKKFVLQFKNFQRLILWHNLHFKLLDGTKLNYLD